MVFFKRIARSRSNSQSYVDSYDSRHDSKTNSASYDDKYASAASGRDSSIDNDPDQGVPVHRQSNHAPHLDDADAAMYARQSQPTEVAQYDSPPYQSPPASAGGRHGMISNGFNSSGGGAPTGGGGGAGGGAAGSGTYETSPSALKMDPAHDLLLQAFNQALRPYSDKIDSLENEIADLKAYIDQLESQRGEVHAWIDKRGLRPDVPASIAQQMDSTSNAASPTHAAATLNAQLDRKITIVNFDLHRLQDDLNDSLPTPSFSACMLKFLPDVSRLNALPSGPRYAFDLLLKLGGNLNSHGGLENGDEEDLAERRSFYARLDDAMVDVVHGRFREEGDAWGVQREIKRIEKTGAYLRNWGVEPYFPHTLGVMKDRGAGAAGAGASGAGAGPGAGAIAQSATGGAQVSPPSYG